jgi:hypothetical protein
MDKGVHVENHAAVCGWKSSFRDILEILSKQCDEMEDALKELDEDAYQEWLWSLPGAASIG